MPSLTTSPATPRNDAADRYSPDTAAELSSGDTRREATRKSEVERIAAMPRTPISSVASTTGSTATRVITPRPRPARRGAAASGPAQASPGTAARPAAATTPGCRPAGPGPAPAPWPAPAAARTAARTAAPAPAGRPPAGAGREGGRARRRPPAAAGAATAVRGGGASWRAGSAGWSPRPAGGGSPGRPRAAELAALGGLQEPVLELPGVPAAHRHIADIGVHEQPAGRVAAQLAHRPHRDQKPPVHADEPGALPVLLQPGDRDAHHVLAGRRVQPDVIAVRL